MAGNLEKLVILDGVDEKREWRMDEVDELF
jgi:hypothetical protein